MENQKELKQFGVIIGILTGGYFLYRVAKGDKPKIALKKIVKESVGAGQKVAKTGEKIIKSGGKIVKKVVKPITPKKTKKKSKKSKSNSHKGHKTKK